ncbi:uncharacterized protein TM35_000103030, partial [Trypanosoma theileri]
MMMMMTRVMCVLAVVLCCACGYTMTAAASTPGQPKAEMAYDWGWEGFLAGTSYKYKECMKNSSLTFDGKNCTALGFINKTAASGSAASAKSPANGNQEARLVVVFGPITQKIYDKHCGNNSAVTINGKTCS